LRINAAPNFTATVTGHGSIKIYLYKYTITENPMCSCKEVDQSVDYIVLECKLLEHNRDRRKAAVTRSDNWPVYKDTLNTKFYNFSKNSRTTQYWTKYSV